ncbi:ABSCISIC ACID-INSENSITIVE 5-like protein 2 isoform X2 [Nymphaea colorata]|nr:ABSCISIC ACID-INSENSITIVE 5-like protein 2 isoform X2 [Nymphaea colorata]
MGAATMATNGGEGPHLPQPQPLVRQGSLYNLTMDQLQGHLGDLGKPLMSMNLEEFLKTVTAAEENLGFGPLTAADPSFLLDSPAVPGILRQPSMVCDQDFGQKTVDDIWREIQQGRGGATHEEQMVERQPTLGEMTLEDFLFRAGALTQTPEPSLASSMQPMPSMPLMPAEVMPVCQQEWMQYQLSNAAAASSSSSSVPPQLQPNLAGMYVHGFEVGGNNPALDLGFVDNPLTAASPILPMPVASQSVDRKRTAQDEIRERAIDRRQRRMIKNRESAARSRARKQAFTTQLEAEVSKLKEVNISLKKEKEIDEKFFTPIILPRYQLRRTSSAPF